MGISAPRDLELLRQGFTRWLRAWRPEAPDVVLAPIERPATGLSSETVFLDVDWHVRARTDAGHERTSFVARLPPDGEGLFPAYDLVAQAEVQRAVADAGLPAVAPLALETDLGWVGAPFLLMPRIPGRAVRADVPYLRSGWLAEAAPHEQARLHSRVVELLASLHRLDWRALGSGGPLRIAGVTGTEASGFDGGDGARLGPELARWRAYLAWAGEGSVPEVFDDAVAWCAEHLPAREPPASLLWGDPQLGNVLVGDDMDVTAMLDFEMASVGPAEVDLAWFMVLHRMTVARCGGDLPGFGDERATVEAYEEHLGRPVTDLRWYEVFAALRSGAVMVRAARLLARLGVDDSWLTRGNPTIELLDSLLAG